MPAAKSKDLTVRFVADTSKWTKPYTRVRRDIDALEKSEPKVKKAFKGIETGAKQLAEKVGTPTTGLSGSLARAKNFFNTMIPGGLLLKIGGLAGALIGVKRAFDALLGAGVQTEDAITKLTVLFGGDAAKALRQYQQALEFSVITPFDPRDVVEAAVIAGQFGADAFRKGMFGMKNDIITLVADMAAFANISMEEAATALLRGDLALLEKFGISARRAYQAAKDVGPLGSQQFLEAFVTNMEKVPVWAGMAEKRSQTISGIWSTIQGNIGLIFTHLSGAALGPRVMTFWTGLKEIIKDFSDGFGDFVETAKPLLIDIGATLGGAFRIAWNFISAVVDILGPFLRGPLVAFFGVLRVTFFVLKNVLNLMADFFRWIGRSSSAFWDLNAAVLGINGGMQSLSDHFENMILKVQMSGVFLRMTFEALIRTAREFVGMIPDFFTGVGRHVEGVFESGKTKIKDLLGFGEGPGVLTRGEEALRNMFMGGAAPAGGSPTSTPPPAPVSHTTNKTVSTDNSSMVTNVFNQGGEMPEWLVRNPYDVTGRPQFAGAF